MDIRIFVVVVMFLSGVSAAGSQLASSAYCEAAEAAKAEVTICD